MSLPEVIRCKTCRVKIRIPEGRDIARAKCPRCQAPLKAAEMTEEGIDELLGDIRVAVQPFSMHKREPEIDSSAPIISRGLPPQPDPPTQPYSRHPASHLEERARFANRLESTIFLTLGTIGTLLGLVAVAISAYGVVVEGVDRSALWVSLGVLATGVIFFFLGREIPR